MVFREHLAPQPPTSALASSVPVYVVVADNRSGCAAGAASVRIEQLPSGCTIGDLAKRLSEGRSLEQSHLRMLVCGPFLHAAWGLWLPACFLCIILSQGL